MKAALRSLATAPLLLAAACVATRPDTRVGDPPASPTVAAAPESASAASAGPAPHGAAPASGPDGWRVAATPYFWLFDIDGTVRTPGGRTVPVSAHLSDAWDLVQDHLRFGFLGHLEAACGDLSLFVDGTYIHVESEASFPAPNPSGGRPGAGELDVDVKLEQIELGAAWRVADVPGAAGRSGPVEVLGGARWNSLRTETDLTLAGGGRVLGFGSDGGTDWVDPFVGARVRVPVLEALDFTARADIGGGFGDGADRAWNVVTTLEWRLTDATSAVVGYRWYDVERSSGGRDLDLQFEGPGIGMIMRF